jgi:hypothetical protein
MNARPEPTPSADPSACPLCGAPVDEQLERCADCGYTLAGVTAALPGFSRVALLWTIAAFVAIYLVTIAIVAATR